MSVLKKFLTSLFTGDDTENTMRKDFAASAAELVEPIIRAQNHAKALFEEFEPDVQKINALLKQAGIDKNIEWELSGEDNTEITLASRGKNSHTEHLVLKATETGSFFSTHSREHCLSTEIGPIRSSNKGPCYYMGSDSDKNIDMINAVIQNHILTKDEVKKVGFTLHEQEQQKYAPRGHSRPNSGIEIKGF
ncbi:MAG: hypothetical protein CMH27_00240 [Micavibrio sp.]|nr:hypothetical protein [Micavibrio sp.]|tara:strand:- start:1470 stop:2045 length:576 start_codon:yes stop_codon:yes gene_type:complete